MDLRRLEYGEEDSANKMKDIADAVEDTDLGVLKIGKWQIVDVIDDAKSAAMDDSQNRIQ